MTNNKQQKWQQKQTKREYKLYVGEMKATNDAQGIVEGILNAIGNIDYGQDRTLPGAFKRTLNNAYERKKADGDDYLWPYLWNHDYDLIPPGGIFDADETKSGLFIKAQLNLDYQLGRDMYSSFKAKMLKKQSMGYIGHQTEYVKEQIDGATVMVRNLIEVEVLEGSGVVFPMNDLADVTNVKHQQNGLYVPKYWPGYTGKGKPMNGKTTATKDKPQEKDFNDRYRQQVISDWCYSDWQNLVIALKQSIQDIFAVGDTPSTDLVDIILNDSEDGAGFISALKAYVQEGIDLDYANYLQEQSQSPYGDGYYDYMSRNSNGARKSGATFSQDNTDAIHGHAAALHDMADAQAKAMHGAADGLLGALQGLGAPSDPSYRQQGTTADDEKSRRRPPSLQGKASEADRQVIGQHATDLHSVADTIHQMAEDLAENTGAQTYVDASGNADNAKETDKADSRTRGALRNSKHSPDTGTAGEIQEDDLAAALASLAQLHETL
jgi:HK97 family phage prohead protease